MNKKEFVASLTDEHRILQEDSEKITEAVFNHIRKHLLQGREVRMDGIGSFSFKYRRPKVMNNNITGTKHKVGPRVRMKFKVFPSMQRSLNAILAKEMSKEDDNE